MIEIFGIFFTYINIRSTISYDFPWKTLKILAIPYRWSKSESRFCVYWKYILCIWKKKISSDIEQGRNLLLLHVYVPHESKYYQKNRKFDLLQGSKQKRTTSCNLLNLFCKKKNVILFSKRLVDNYSNCRVRKFKRDVLKKKRLEKIVLEGELLTLMAYNKRTKIWEHIFQ